VIEVRNRIAWTLIHLRRFAEAEAALARESEYLEARGVDSLEEELYMDRLLVALRDLYELTDRPVEEKAAESRRMALELYRR
jgi:hypothetical protein